MVDVLLILWDACISMFDVLLILWDTKYFDPLHTACNAHTRYLGVPILLNTQYFQIQYWLYCILKVNQVFPLVDTPYTKHYVVFSGGRYCLYWAIRSIFGSQYCLYYAIRSIFVESILLILSKMKYFQGVDIAYTKQYAVFLGSILLTLSNT